MAIYQDLSTVQYIWALIRIQRLENNWKLLPKPWAQVEIYFTLRTTYLYVVTNSVVWIRIRIDNADADRRGKKIAENPSKKCRKLEEEEIPEN